jgi:type I restriction enzyme S subunit
MSEWKEIYLTDAYTIDSGLSKPACDFGSGFPFLSFKNVFNNSFVPEKLSELVESNEKERLTCSIKRGDIFLTRTSETVKELGMSCVALTDFPNATFNGFTKRLRPNNNYQIVPEYVGYYLRSSKFRKEVTAMSSASTRASLNNEMIGRLKIVLPSQEEQKRIADVLSCLDSKIENLRRQNETLEKIAQTLFRHWFIDFEFPNADGKPYKSSGGAMLPSELGYIPESWGTFRLIETVEQLKPGTNYQPERVSQGIPFINVKNIQNGFLSLQNVKYITEEEYKRVHKSWIPEENDILISRIGTLGNVGVIRKQDLPVAVHYNNLNIKSKKISFQLLYFILKSDFFQTQYHSKKMQSVQEYITVEEAGNLKIILPELPQALGDFERIFKNTFDKVRNNENQIQTLTKTRDLLLPKLMSGQIRVKE